MDDRFGTIAEELHVASRNSPTLKEEIAARTRAVHEAARAETPGPPRARVPGTVRLRERARSRMTLEAAITARRSGRAFGERPLRRAELATLLALGNGVREVREGFVQRNAPSSGNLGSTSVYPIVLSVQGAAPGIYRFDALGHALEPVRKGRFTTWLAEHALLQPEPSRAAVALVLVADFSCLRPRYGLRAHRLALLDAGHVSENVQLVATSLGLVSCACGGFIDDELDRALALDGVDRASVLVVMVGTPPRGPGRVARGAQSR